MKKKLAALVLVLAVPALAGAAQYGKMTLETKLESMKKAGVGPVIYPHDKHELLFKCNECQLPQQPGRGPALHVHELPHKCRGEEEVIFSPLLFFSRPLPQHNQKTFDIPGPAGAALSLSSRMPPRCQQTRRALLP